ncbi:MAG: endonuclease/exonuclease/phosphatase family protein [Steroidobacteraceae bacterium]|jgi:endonuclease/exonuclease/phosphatase (EEP) superfamily protein YafD|nr:endonuclease/exonuclease/phosphatase family protein [Steroidobacteraceae bacterium]
MSALLWKGFCALVYGAAAASLLALLADRLWLAELAVNFRVQYLALGLVAAVVLALRRSLPLAAASLLIVVLNVGPVVRLLDAELPPTVPAPADARAAVPRAGVPLKIASANLLFLNDEHAAVIAWARRVQPEILLFLETTAEWRRALAPLAAEYPYGHYVTDDHHHGLLLLSRWPLSDLVTAAPGGRVARPVIFATVTKQGTPLRLAAMHATWPMRPRDARQRSHDLEALAAEAARRGPLPFVGLGDLNTSPFSPYYAELLRAGGLRSAATGHGWEPTWPSLFLPFGIQIDHALVSPEVQVRAFNRGPPNGSDHMPIIVEVTIPQK